MRVLDYVNRSVILISKQTRNAYHGRIKILISIRQKTYVMCSHFEIYSHERNLNNARASLAMYDHIFSLYLYCERSDAEDIETHLVDINT